MRASSLVIAVCAAGAGVSAHGFLSSVTVNGNAYNGDSPFGNNDPSIIRKVNSPDPNYGAENPALTCGPGALAASQSADVNPGDTFTFNWRGADNSRWPHNTGPMLTYMASCGSSTCDQFDATQGKWFKIHQVGRQDGSALWKQQDLYNGGVATVIIPTNLAPGNYLIRHEIIALHLATQRRGAEFYPGCTQLRVGGSQTGKPADSELVSFPGAYSDDDPGIYDPDVYNPAMPYQFPGPKVAAFVPASTAGTPNSNNSTATTRTGGTPTSTPTGLSTPTATVASGRVCRLKRRPDSSLQRRGHYFRHAFLFSWSV